MSAAFFLSLQTSTPPVVRAILAKRYLRPYDQCLLAKGKKPEGAHNQNMVESLKDTNRQVLISLIPPERQSI